MTVWTPEWKLTVNGVDYTSKAIASVSHTAGRRDIYQQPTASYLQVEIVDLNDLAYDFNINDGLTLQVKDSSGNFVTIFGGTITDVMPQVRSSGSVTNIISFTLIALGSLAKLTRAVTNGVLSKDFDGNQIFKILSEILYDTWSEVPAATTWAGYDATTTWADAFNSGVGEVDKPGDYELTARTSSATNAYSLVTSLANSGLGYVYEDSEGRIGYADSTHRSQYLSANGYVEVSANDALAPGLSSLIRASDVRNDVTISYKNNATVNVKDLTSQSLYGSLGSVIPTTLENTADATAQANFYLAIRAYPAQNLNNITFALQNPDISDSDRDSLLGVFMGMPLDITDLPEAIVTGGRYQGFIEGWSFKTSYNGLFLTLYLSPVSYSLQAFRWNSVPITEKWNTLNPTMDWNNATIVA
jgi:hypothetical protein